MLVLASVTAVGGLLRFSTLGTQSFWFDEAATVYLVRASFAGMLSAIHATETTPPLYFALAWVWAHVFGSGEVGLRSLSALLGTATIPVTYAAARTLVGRRAGVIAALLAALSPMLVWYSQEARSYALLVLLCAVSLLFFGRIRQRPAPGNFVGWAVASSLAVGTHYFAVFLLIPEAIWLLSQRAHRRAAVLASAVVAATGLALMPLALYQRAHSGVDWIGFRSFGGRVKDTVALFASGTPRVGLPGSWILGGLALAAVVVLGLRRADARTRGGALVALGLGTATIALALGLAVVGDDYVLARNLLPAWLPLCIGAAAALGARRTWKVGLAAAFAVCVVFVVFDVRLATWHFLERDDWRGVARVLGAPRQARAIVVAPGWEVKPLSLYLPQIQFMGPTRSVAEVDIVVYNGFVPARSRPQIPTPGVPFVLVGSRKTQKMTVSRFAAPHPTPVSSLSLSGTRTDRSQTLPFFQPASASQKHD